MAIPLASLLDLAKRTGLVDPATAERVRQDVLANKTDPLRALTYHARIPPATVYQAMAQDAGVEYVGRQRLGIRPEHLKRIPEALVRRKQVLPVHEEKDFVLFAVGDPEALRDERLRETLRRAFDKPVRYALADPDDLSQSIERILSRTPADAAADVRDEDAVAFVDDLMREAFVRRASDIHLEPDARGYRVRYRVDGELAVHKEGVPFSIALAALSRLKVLGRMDIAETREPQDGSMVYDLPGTDGRRFDVRIATAPTNHGERATLRLLGVETRDLTLDALGFAPAMHERFREIIRRPSGLILLTGPTGSGKTTTLYAALREISRPGLNILTVEDPVEYSIEGVSQLEVDAFGKVTFSSALRSLLRHDPDVLMVGEIRDKETADLALRAAMTGHLVFSTLHTSTAVGAVTRLVDMKCEPYMIAATLLASVSQRLVRRLCPSCKAPRPRTPEDDAFLGPPPGKGEGSVFEAKGCLRCSRTGFLGRVGVFEMFHVDEDAREAISRDGSERDIARAARRLTLLKGDAADKVVAGLTTLAEVRRVAALEE